MRKGVRLLDVMLEWVIRNKLQAEYRDETSIADELCPLAAETAQSAADTTDSAARRSQNAAKRQAIHQDRYDARQLQTRLDCINFRFFHKLRVCVHFISSFQ